MDFELLHQEVASAVEADKKYERENDAKFRAVEQKVENYNQFAAIVKGCHLQSLDKKESICNLTRSTCSWNSCESNPKYSLESEIAKYFPTVDRGQNKKPFN